MDKFESIKAFTKVVEEGGFAAAARKMQLSRSSVNKLVINLENQLGVQLLYRTTRQVTPTDTGRVFYDRCLAILSSLEEAEILVSQQHEQPKGILKINAPMSFGISFLGAKIADFMAEYKQVKIQLTLEDRFVDPIAEGYDLVIRIGSPISSPNLVVDHLTTIPRVICASPGYLETHGIPQNISELKNHACLTYGYLATGCQWLFINSNGDEETVKIESIFCSNNGETLRDIAVKGLGIALLPTFIVVRELKEGRLQVILSDYQCPQLNLSTIYPLHRHLSTKIRLFNQFLQECLTPENNQKV